MRKSIFLSFVAIAALLMSGCKSNAGKFSGEEVAAMKAQWDSLLAGQRLTDEYLVKFDTLDYVVFTRQEWARFHESHAGNIKVYWPDGHFTEGLPRHVEDMKSLFVWAPDTRVTQHPIRFGSGRFTGVTGFNEGTFTEPMPIGDGKFIPPTGKKFKVPMCTIGVWENGVMVEEHLFWDELTLRKQIGILE